MDAENIGAAFLRSAEKFGGKTAIISGDRTHDFAAWRAAAMAAAAAFERRSEGPRVGIMLPTSDAFAFVFMGALLSGRAAVPLNFLLSPDELSLIVRDAGLETVVTTAAFEAQARALPARLEMAEEFLPRAAAEFRGAPRFGENPVAAIIYTSGTTGVPKGVVLSHRNILSNALGCVEHFRFEADEVLLGILPLFHTFELTTTLVVPAAIGATAVLSPRFEPGAAVAAIERHRVTTMLAVPSMYRAMTRAVARSRGSLGSVKLPISGGESLPEQVLSAYRDEFCITLYEGYGLTEASPVVSANTPWAMKPATVGKPLPNVEVNIVDDGGGDAGVDADGEIWVRGPSVMTGYLNRPEETAEALTPDGYLRTGDIGRLDAEGFLRITGRKKDLIISAGENVYPREVERALELHPAVAEAAVVGVPDASRGEAVKAFVRLKDSAAATPAELVEFSRGRLARYKVPSHVEIRGELPHSPMGKILKRELR